MVGSEGVGEGLIGTKRGRRDMGSEGEGGRWVW